MFILGAIIIAIGTFLTIKTEWFMTNFGRIAWFEDKLGSEGGSRIGYKLLGILAIFIGIVLISGNGLNFFSWLSSPLTSKL
jgi:hypothetical protein